MTGKGEGSIHGQSGGGGGGDTAVLVTGEVLPCIVIRVAYWSRKKKKLLFLLCGLLLTLAQVERENCRLDWTRLDS